MTERELTPEEEAEVSRLLSDAADPVVMPAQVASRLDDVLASLVAERSAAVTTAPEPGDDDLPVADVVPLRSRRWPKLLLAAAAVAVVGYTGANLPHLTGGNADNAASFDSSQSGKESAGDSAGGSGVDSPAAPERAPLPAGKPLTTLEQKAAAAVRHQLRGTVPQPQFSTDSNFLRDAVGGCVPPPAAAGTKTFEVELDRTHTVVVVLSPLSGGRTRADAYPCRGPAASVATAIVR